MKRIYGYQSTTQIVSDEVSGVQLDVSHFFEVPIACLCISCTDACKYFCGNNEDEDEEKYAGCTQCLKDSSENDYCAHMSLRFASFPISDFVMHDLNNPCKNFRFENEIVNTYEFDYIVKLFEDYERHLFEERLLKIQRYMDGESHFLNAMSEKAKSISYSPDETDDAFKYLFGNERWQTWHEYREFNAINELISTEEDEDFDLFV